MRARAVKDLGKARKKETVPGLIDLLKRDKNAHVRMYTAESLASISDKSAVPELIKQAKTEPEQGTRMSVVLALGQLGDESAIPTLKDIFLDDKENLGVRLQAGNALSYFACDKAFDALTKGLESGNATIRLQAITSLGNILSNYKLQERIAIFKDKLNDPDEKVTNAAKFNLEKLGIKE